VYLDWTYSNSNWLILLSPLCNLFITLDS